MDRARSRTALGGDRIDAGYLLFWNLLGGANLSLEHGLAKGDDRSPSAYRAARRTDWQAHPCDSPGMRRCEGDHLRTAESPVRSVFEDLARHPNRCLSWHCPADGGQAGIVGVDHRCGNLDNSRLLSSVLAGRHSGTLSAPSADVGD